MGGSIANVSIYQGNAAGAWEIAFPKGVETADPETETFTTPVRAYTSCTGGWSVARPPTRSMLLGGFQTGRGKMSAPAVATTSLCSRPSVRKSASGSETSVRPTHGPVHMSIIRWVTVVDLINPHCRRPSLRVWASTRHTLP